MPSPATFVTEVRLVKNEKFLSSDVLRDERRREKVVKVSFLITFFLAFSNVKHRPPMKNGKWS